jgi:hypothetical protein
MVMEMEMMVTGPHMLAAHTCLKHIPRAGEQVTVNVTYSLSSSAYFHFKRMILSGKIMLILQASAEWNPT